MLKKLLHSAFSLKSLTSLILLFVSLNTFAANPDDLLPPDEAFSPSLSSSSPESLTATWNIADGYYMYRKRFSFESETPGITLGEATFPKGKIKDDPGFGKVETYRNKIAVQIPLIRDASVSSATELSLKTKSQGCADIGVCYPPQKKTLTLKLAALPAPAMDPIAAAKKPGALSLTAPANDVFTPTASSSIAPIPLSDKAPAAGLSLADELGITGLDAPNEPLHPDEAFGFDLTAVDKQTLNARWDILEGHYLYQHKFKFEIIDPASGVSLQKVSLPKGKEEHDQYFGDIVIYNKPIDVKLPFTGETDEITVKSSYQGCSKLTGICYPPQHKTQKVSLTNAPATIASADTSATSNAGDNNSTATANTVAATNAVAATTKVSAQDGFVNKLLTDSFLVVLFTFFLAGLALTFTPCVFPMIPILSGIIAGQGSDNSTRKSFFLSLSYVLAMASTYAIVGVIAALSGENLQVALQNPWVIGAFAGLFVLLSLAMFGFYELQMPASIQSKLTNISNSQSGGSMLNAGIMGLLSALIVGPCVTAPLIGALIYIAQTKDVVLGGLSLFALGLGMGVPLLIIGTSAGKILPRAGAWMDKVKAGFGIMMLALAIWMLERILPMTAIVLLSGILAIFTGIYMGGLDALNEASSGWKRFFKASGLVTLLYGAMLLIGAASGNGSLIHPLKGSFASGGSSVAAVEQKLVFRQIKGVEGLDQALALAKQQGQTVMLDFYADWCISCKEMEHGTFTDLNVINSLKDTVLLQADVTPNDDLDKALLKKFGLFGPPGILFFDKNSKENLPFRIVGEMKADPFNNHVQEFLKTVK
jgi:thiol:disulfide interchange protein DsbD